MVGMADAFDSALKNIKLVVVHANCPDGMASAIFVKDAMPDVEIQFIQYNTDEHKALTPRPNVMFCDFSPFAETAEVEGPDGKKTHALTDLGKEQVKAWVDAGALLLDHHAAVKQIGMLQPFVDAGLARFGDEATEPGVCGAVLAYRHVWRPILDEAYADAVAHSGDGGNDASYHYQSMFRIAEEFATLAGIRDTWQKKSPDWRRACVQAEMLRFFPPENWFSKKDPFVYGNQGWWHERMALGELLIAKHERTIAKTLEKAHRFTTAKGTRVVVFSGTHLSSDASEALGEEADLVVGFDYQVEGGKQKLICSNRTRGSFPVLAFAMSYGGGGHKNAAGCSRILGGGELNPYGHIKQLVEAFEVSQAT